MSLRAHLPASLRRVTSLRDKLLQRRIHSLKRQRLPGVFISRSTPPPNPARPAPRVEHQAVGERLTARRHDQSVVLTPRVHSGHRQMKLQRLDIQLLQVGKKVVGPLIAQPAFAEAKVDKIIVDPWGAHHPILLREGDGLFNRFIGQPCRLSVVHVFAERQKHIAQGFRSLRAPHRICGCSGASRSQCDARKQQQVSKYGSRVRQAHVAQNRDLDRPLTTSNLKSPLQTAGTINLARKTKGRTKL